MLIYRTLADILAAIIQYNGYKHELGSLICFEVHKCRINGCVFDRDRPGLLAHGLNV